MSRLFAVESLGVVLHLCEWIHLGEVWRRWVSLGKRMREFEKEEGRCGDECGGSHTQVAPAAQVAVLKIVSDCTRTLFTEAISVRED